ncbi:MAG: hypothetical protein ICV74_10475 [Thermoleophilia bacterium]|nr:hypothetical protein [Thermoleophilia bacterium]
MAESVNELFDDFAARRARGERPDVREYLARAGPEADALASLLDRLLASTPPPPADPGTVAAFEGRLAGEPPLLALRTRRGLPRTRVVDALVQTLGLDAGKSAKVKRYYHELETGLLDPRGVSGRVFSVLERVLDARVEELAAWRPPPAQRATATAFFRVRDDVAKPAPERVPAEEGWDEVDALFRGASR